MTSRHWLRSHDELEGMKLCETPEVMIVELFSCPKKQTKKQKQTYSWALEDTGLDSQDD